MMEKSIVEILREQGQGLYVVASGAGASLFTQLWSPPGASEFLAGGAFPYASGCMENFLGFAPDSHCAEGTAVDMAIEAAIRAAEAGYERPLGMGVTAVASSTRVPRGGLRAWVAVVGDLGVRCERLELSPGTGSDMRELNEAEVRVGSFRVLSRYLESGQVSDLLGWGRLFERPSFRSGKREPATEGCAVYVPASLNPLHEGHETLRKKAERKVNTPARYLVCTTPVHKPPLHLIEAIKKVADARQVEGCTVEFSRGDPLFIDKIKHRPASIFVLGADTLLRMMDPKWGPSFEEILGTALNNDVVFYVADRKVDGVTRSLSNIGIPKGYKRLFVRIAGIPEVSSTDIREGS